MGTPPLLSIEGLRVGFPSDAGEVYPVDGVQLHVSRGRTLGVVGESGCGKSLTALAILRLIPSPPGRIAGGTIRYGEHDLTACPEDEIRGIRGKEIGMIFQEPMTSLNPVFTCGEQIAEVLRVHEGMGRRQAMERAIELLSSVQIPDAQRRAGEYPHQLSGGLRQRVMIAMAIACRPGLLIADEPTTALDVTIQEQILELLDRLQDEMDMGVLHITHDLGVIAQSAHRVLVMYAGKVVEEAKADSLFSRPAHPYTLGLVASRPRMGHARETLTSIPGQVPPPDAMPSGCRFAPRCPFAVERCRVEDPPLAVLDDDHRVACWEAERVRSEGRWPPDGSR